jgi:hypothetical protein
MKPIIAFLNFLAITTWSIFIKATPESVVKFWSKYQDSKLALFLITPLIAFLMTHEFLVYTLMLLSLLDLVTGIEKTANHKKLKLNLLKKENWKNWRVITSEGIRKTCNKIKDYGLLTIVIFLLETNVIGKTIIEFNPQNFTLTAWTLVGLCFIEVWSIYENREEIGKRNYLKIMLNFLPEKVQDLFKKIKPN